MQGILIQNKGMPYLVDPTTIVADMTYSQVRLKGIEQRNYKQILLDLKYYIEKGDDPANEFPPIIVFKNKDDKLEVIDGNHRLKAFLEEKVVEIRVTEEVFSHEHEKIKTQVANNLHPTATSLNKKSRIHALKSYMIALNKDKSIKKDSYEFPLKHFAKKVKKDSDAAFSGATSIVQDMFNCNAALAKTYLEDSIVFTDPKQRSWERKELLCDEGANSTYAIEKPSTKKPDNGYVVIPVFHSAYLWNNAIGTAYKAKTIYKCKVILRIADDGRADHLDTFRKTIVSEAQKINNSGILRRGRALFDEIQFAPQKTGYENETLKEEGFFSVPDRNELEKGSRADFDISSIPNDGWIL